MDPDRGPAGLSRFELGGACGGGGWWEEGALLGRGDWKGGDCAWEEVGSAAALSWHYTMLLGLAPAKQLAQIQVAPGWGVTWGREKITSAGLRLRC